MSGIEGSAPAAPARPGVAPASRASARGQRALYAALDLGTNNCRLLIAAPAGAGAFRVVHGWSQIVRLGEGLSATGRLGDAAMARTMAALAQCAERLAERGVKRVGCVATQACRQALNGQDFLDRVRRETGLDFTIISAEEESQLAVMGCASLIDPDVDRALVVDIGGGSTELSLVDARTPDNRILQWASAPLGVVQLAETIPERDARDDWYAHMRAHVRDALAANIRIDAAQALRDGRAHMIGTSGTVTSLAGVHMRLPRYQRAKVDGAWMSAQDCIAAAAELRAMPISGRAAHPCIGPDRADLVLPGCAILEAVLDLWPAQRLRVADRGLREGVLLSLMAEDGW